MIKMTKQDILFAFNDAIESTRLWNEMADHLFAIGAELFETKYAESLQLHQELVWKLIKEFRNYDELNEYEFTAFIDILYDLSRNEPVTYKDNNGIHHTLTNREEILDLFLSPDFIMMEIITINPELMCNC
jgi:hypothetical protein